MTALSRYQRLECPALWRESPRDRAREVIVSFGDASLILSDVKSNLALTHWSLPAAERLNPGEVPAIYSPDPRGEEVLEIADPTMVDAIEQVRRAIDAQRPRPGRLRAPLILTLAVGAALAVVLVLPDALIRHTARALPLATRTDISDKVIRDMTRVTGPVCTSPAGDRALAKLWARLGDGKPGGIIVLPRGFDAAAHLPDGRILLQRALVADDHSPEETAGFVLAEEQRAAAADPMVPLLRAVGLPATLRLLTTGELPESALNGYAEVMLTRPVVELDQEALLVRFAAVGVPSTPFAFATDPTGESVLTLIEGDPFRGRPPPEPVLTDSEWVGLQGICPR